MVVQIIIITSRKDSQNSGCFSYSMGKPFLMSFGMRLHGWEHFLVTVIPMSQHSVALRLLHILRDSSELHKSRGVSTHFPWNGMGGHYQVLLLEEWFYNSIVLEEGSSGFPENCTSISFPVFIKKTIVWITMLYQIDQNWLMLLGINWLIYLWLASSLADRLPRIWHKRRLSQDMLQSSEKFSSSLGSSL